MRQATIALSALVLASVQTALPAALGLSTTRLDLLTCMVVWLGLYAPTVVQGAALSLWCGYLADVYSGGPPVLFTFLAAVLFVASRLIAAQLAGEGWFFAASLGFGASAVQGLSAFALLWLMQSAERSPAVLWSVPKTALATALFAPVVFFLMRQTARLERGPDLGALS